MPSSIWLKNKNHSTLLRRVRLGAVSHCVEFDSVQCETILDFQTFQFPDSAQCDTARSWTRCSVILRGVGLGAVWYCAESDSAKYHTARSHVFCKYLRENEFFRETILDCLSGTQMGWINKERKKCQKSRDTVSLSNKCHQIKPFKLYYFWLFFKITVPWCGAVVVAV